MRMKNPAGGRSTAGFPLGMRAPLLVPEMRSAGWGGTAGRRGCTALLELATPSPPLLLPGGGAATIPLIYEPPRWQAPRRAPTPPSWGPRGSCVIQSAGEALSMNTLPKVQQSRWWTGARKPEPTIGLFCLSGTFLSSSGPEQHPRLGKWAVEGRTLGSFPRGRCS